MKYLLVLAVVAVAFFIWRSNREQRVHDEHRQRRNTRGKLAQPETMTRCAQCGTHLPESEAVPGRLGHYCSAAHRQQAEG